MRPNAVVVNDGYLCGTGKLNDFSNNLPNRFLMFIVRFFQFCEVNIISLQALKRMPIDHIFNL